MQNENLKLQSLVEFKIQELEKVTNLFYCNL